VVLSRSGFGPFSLTDRYYPGQSSFVPHSNGSKSNPLVIIQQDAFVLLLLLDQDSDLLLEAVYRSVESLIDTIRQTSDDYEPRFVFHGPAGLIDRATARRRSGKRCRNV